ncbi:MAG TPA: 23S rRNA (adenine(2503)-C(2))-methyltransferase RlmN [Cyanobacteria bacterium UBA8530]|nr:23S rRNA (adenine(2503)-C(2))-methyltransferase RlmN [Cyanobacteria bacterium UBA8530]
MIELVGMKTSELRDFAVQSGEKNFRGTQLARWIYDKNISQIDEMTDLSLAFREKLKEQNASLSLLEEIRSLEDGEKTRKFLFKLNNKKGKEENVESVLLPYPERVTACISTQVGCAIGCRFCATGETGFVRDLSAGEIVDQVRFMNRHSDRRITNVVLMGMGEPLLNYEATLKAIDILNEEMGIGMRGITLSTCGITPKIRELAKRKLQLTLAVSLHAPSDEMRDSLVPINRKYPLAELKEAMKEYAELTGRRVTIEYVMLRDVNDTVVMARRLADYLRGLHCQINLIPCHEAANDFLPSDSETMHRFAEVLKEIGFPVTTRAERGLKIAAACGQLRRRVENA